MLLAFIPKIYFLTHLFFPSNACQQYTSYGHEIQGDYNDVVKV